MDTCKICGKAFQRRYRRRGVRQVYCSKACTYQDHYRELDCPTCGGRFRTNLLSRRKTYCSLACIQRSPCQLCGIIITGRRRFQGGARRFCSRRCASVVNASVAGKKNYVVRGFAATIRRTGKIACERCGFGNPFGLTVHHADGDHGNVSDANLITLCANCHAIEHWNDSAARKRQMLIAAYLAKHQP